MNKYTFIFFTIITSYSIRVLGQASLSDSLFLHKPVKKAIDRYIQAVHEESNLYNGREYTGYDRKIKGTPYFEASYWNTGSVFYDGSLYKDIPILYDVVEDAVVVPDFSNNLKIKLVNDKVSYFTLLNHRFIQISNNSKDTTVSGGFYDVLVDGRVKIYAKRVKTIYETTTSALVVEREFMAKDRIYIYKDNIYHTVTSKSSVLKLLKEQKKEISKYLRKNKIRFRGNRENAIVKMVEYYNSLVQ